MEITLKAGDSLNIPEGCKAIIEDDLITIIEEKQEEFKEGVDHEFYFDTNGYKLDDSIIGIEIIGNIIDNPELMK